MTKLQTDRFKYLIIGSGRLATHFQQYFHLLKSENTLHSYAINFSLDTWDRAQDPHLLQTKIANSTHVLLAISDSSIESFVNKNLLGLDKIIIHFSGALDIQGTIAAHPLMSFSHDLYSLDIYEKIHFAVTGTNSLLTIFPFFKNKFTLLSAQDKALYHSYCVMSGNLPVILWTQIQKEMTKLNFPAEILDLYLQQVLKNFISLREKALTGPIARKDLVTIQKNIDALPQPEFQKIYQLFTEIPL